MKKYFFALCVCSLLYQNAQQILWEKTLGGKHSEYLYDMKATPDYGFIIAGSSLSDKTGNKEQANQGNLDFLLWKLDENGNTEWQQSFGTASADELYSVALTQDGGYILGGSSQTEQTDNPNYYNEDYVILKLNAKGEKEWEQRLGGIGQDKLLCVLPTQDGGYLAGGSSDSEAFESNPSLTPEQKSLLKNENSRGNMDYWLVKLNAAGKVLWQKTYGGLYFDLLRAIVPATDGGYLLAGYSNSPESKNGQGEKKENNQGEGDFWIIKIDNNGAIKWQKTIGTKADDQLFTTIATDSGFWLAGNTQQNGEADMYLIAIDTNGETLWKKTYSNGANDILISINPYRTAEGKTQYLLSGYLQDTTDKSADYIVLSVDEKGNIQWTKTLGGKESDRLQSTVQTRDGGFVLAGTSNSSAGKDKKQDNQGRDDFYIVKLLGKDTELSQKKGIEIYPNPTERFVNLIIDSELLQSGNAQLQVVDINGKLLQQLKITQSTTAVDLQHYQPGVYLFNISLNGKEQSVKVIKTMNN